MVKAPESPYLVPFDGSFRLKHADTTAPAAEVGDKNHKAAIDELLSELDHLQRMFYASGNRALLLIFQGMDASGKDSTIRAVLKGVDHAGCEVHSFKPPSPQELRHDFLWRTTLHLPECGRIGVFNRSYYEEVLTVRVHPEYLQPQCLPAPPKLERLWERRLQSINDHEKHLARNGTIVRKFWLNISRDEQRKRLLSRIVDPHKNWKFAESDVVERGHWDDYMAAYEQALAATSTKRAPWYALPADDKPYMQYCVADILVRTLRSLDLSYPAVDREQQQKLQTIKTLLEEGG